MKFFDKKGKEIHEFDIIKIFHSIGARNKRHYMYKWIRIIEGRMCGMHLTSNNGGNYCLKATADENGVIDDAEVVQCYHE